MEDRAPAREAARRGPARRARRVGLSTVVLLAPACLLFGVFVIYPIVASIRLFAVTNGTASA